MRLHLASCAFGADAEVVINALVLFFAGFSQTFLTYHVKLTMLFIVLPCAARPVALYLFLIDLSCPALGDPKCKTQLGITAFYGIPSPDFFRKSAF